MEVRQVRPTDAPLALALALDDGSHLVRRVSWSAGNPVMRTLLQAALPLAVSGRAWIAREAANVALLEAEPRQYVLGWDITRLAVRGNAEIVLPPVVQAAIAHLQSRGVPRLFARCRQDGCSALAALEFQPLAQEYLLARGPEPTEDAPLPADSRYRMPADAWPLHRLQQDITPSPVRQMEGLSSLDWTQRARTRSEVVVERDGRIAAWVGWGTKPRHGAVHIGMLVHPDYKELAPDLLQHALQQAPCGCRLTARVREYQVETLEAYLDAGFEIVAQEVLMIKHARAEAVPAAARLLRRVVSVPGIQAFHSREPLAAPVWVEAPSAPPPLNLESSPARRYRRSAPSAMEGRATGMKATILPCEDKTT